MTHSDDERAAVREESAAGAEDGTDAPIRVVGPDHLADIVDEHSLALVHFYADWSNPCERFEATVEELARTTDAVVAAVDVDVQQLIAAQYDIRSVPTLVVVSGGETVDRAAGIHDHDSLAEMVARHATN